MSAARHVLVPDDFAAHPKESEPAPGQRPHAENGHALSNTWQPTEAESRLADPQILRDLHLPEDPATLQRLPERIGVAGARAPRAEAAGDAVAQPDDGVERRHHCRDGHGCGQHRHRARPEGGVTWLVAVFAGEEPISARAQPQGTGLHPVKRLREGQVALVTAGTDTHWVMPRWCDVVT
jgi:hypothetical protein